MQIDGVVNFLVLTVNGASPAGSSTITIGRKGSVLGAKIENAAIIRNYGSIAIMDTSEPTAVEFKGNGTHVLTNSGSILGRTYSIFSAAAELSEDQVTNLGILRGEVDLGGGKDTLVNSGRIFGSVDLGDGDDVFTNFKGSKGGLVTGSISLGAGSDTFKGGAKAEAVHDGLGADEIKLGGGNDSYNAYGEVSGTDDGEDTVYGGSGTDTYNAPNVTTFKINLDKIKHGDVEANTSYTAPSDGTAGTERVYEFENVLGTLGGDLIYGSSAANKLNGNGGDDKLYGLGGKDSLSGSGGADTLTGGLGRDTLTGGDEADVFVFESIKDTGKKSTICDVITDFKFAGDADKIDLSAIDADPKSDRNAFLFIYEDKFSGVAGQLRYRWIPGSSGDDTLIEGDVNGDGRADFAILLTGKIELVPTDFNL